MNRLDRIISAGRMLWQRFKPIFSAAPPTPGTPSVHQFNYRRMWKTAVLTAGGVAVIPLIIITMVDYKVTQEAIYSEFLLHTARVVSNTRRSISFFLDERRSALGFIVRDNQMEDLLEHDRLKTVLNNLQSSFGGGFMDLGVIDHHGIQRAYAGPFALAGRNYADQSWFREVAERGMFVSDVFLGYRKIPHLVIAVKDLAADGSFYILRASVGIEPFERLLAKLELGGQGDAFIINREGVLQTTSRRYGQLLEQVSLALPEYSDHTEVLESKSASDESLIVGYRFLEGTPFILMVAKKKDDLLAGWYKTRLELIAFLIISVTVILSVILGMVTLMVSRIYEADQRRLSALHQVEYANKMASIGRMAASVAHEINNPLAIINEKAGLIKDLFVYKKAYAEDQKLNTLLDSIGNSVRRAGNITKRLLTFARNLEATRVESVSAAESIREVLSFLGKEAEHRGITISVNASEDMPPIQVHRGKLQQIFLNIINNAVAAVPDNGGRIWIDLHVSGQEAIAVDIADNGHGIAKQDLHRIFEPFFSTKVSCGGTGLGLSITYNLIQEIGAKIAVESEVGKGTRFTVLLPTRIRAIEGANHACVVGG